MANLIQVRTIDEQLKILDLNFFSRNISSNINYFLNNKQNFNTISGGMGSVYLSNTFDYAVKITKICTNQLHIYLKAELCRISTEGNLFFHIPNTITNKTILLTPNYLTEILIHKLIYQTVHLYTPSFIQTYDFYYMINTKSAIMMLEKLVNPANTLFQNDVQFTYIVFQILHGIYTAQKLCRFTHYDLHQGNFLLRKYNNRKLNEYRLSNGKILYTYFDFDSVITDYGFSRMETKEHIILPRALHKDNIGNELLNYYEFDPYYDTAIFLSSVLKLLINNNFNENDKKVKLVNCLINKFINYNNISFQDVILNNFRPNTSKLSMYNFASTETIMFELINFLQKELPQLLGIDFKSYMTSYSLFISDTEISFANIDTKYDIIPNDKIMDIDVLPYTSTDKRKIEFHNIKISLHNQLNDDCKIRETIEEFNHTLSSGSFHDQYIHAIKIDQNHNTKGYEFRFDCCRIDTREYFQENKIISGVAINGTFFNINSNYLPIGPSKFNNFNSNVDIPQVYMNDYALICIKDNKIIFDNIRNKDKHSNYFCSGPVLVYDNNIVMTEDKLRTEIYINPNNNNDPLNGTLKWQCDKNNQNTKTIIKNNKKIFNCNEIKPGEISRASNPNPRTVIALDNEDNVIFINIEGRKKRGYGVDLSQLAHICKYCFNCKYAINLDGEWSTIMAWKQYNNNKIYISDPEHMDAYPVGNIISYVRLD